MVLIKIPHISHHIWFTDSNKPREIKESDIQAISKSMEVLDSQNSNWKHILWTNNKNLIPSSVEKIIKMGGEVKDISEFTNNPSSAALDKALESKQYAMASDILRYALVKEFGGVYMDLDYTLYKPIDNLTNTFDIFLGNDDASNLYFGNAFIAAKPNHQDLCIKGFVASLNTGLISGIRIAVN